MTLWREVIYSIRPNAYMHTKESVPSRRISFLRMSNWCRRSRDTGRTSCLLNKQSWVEGCQLCQTTIGHPNHKKKLHGSQMFTFHFSSFCFMSAGKKKSGCNTWPHYQLELLSSFPCFFHIITLSVSDKYKIQSSFRKQTGQTTHNFNKLKEYGLSSSQNCWLPSY